MKIHVGVPPTLASPRASSVNHCDGVAGSVHACQTRSGVAEVRMDALEDRQPKRVPHQGGGPLARPATLELHMQAAGMPHGTIEYC